MYDESTAGSANRYPKPTMPAELSAEQLRGIEAGLRRLLDAVMQRPLPPLPRPRRQSRKRSAA